MDKNRIAGSNKNDGVSLPCNKYLHRLMYPNEYEPYDESDSENDESDSEEVDFLYMKNLNEVSTYFEKFDKWELLPPEIRSFIAKKIDFFTRMSLMMTSKANYDIVQSVPVAIKRISISNGYIEGKIDIDVTFTSSDRNDEQKYVVSLVGNGENTEVHRSFSPNAGMTTLENRDYLEQSVLTVNSILKMANYRVDELEVGAVEWAEDSDIMKNIRIEVRKKMYFYARDDETVSRWLDTATAPLVHLDMFLTKFMGLGDNANHNTIKNAKKVTIAAKYGFDDEDLLNMQFQTLYIMDNGVSFRGANEFLKKWVNGDGPENFRSVIFGYIDTDHEDYIENNEDLMRANDTVLLLNGLKCVKWDELFEEANDVLSNWIRSEYPGQEYYYLESNNKQMGGTLVRGTYNVSFLVTGKRR